MQNIIYRVVVKLNTLLLFLLNLVGSYSGLGAFILLVELFEGKTVFFFIVIRVLPELANKLMILSILLLSEPELFVDPFKYIPRDSLHQVRVVLVMFHSHNETITHSLNTATISHYSKLFKYVNYFFKISFLNSGVIAF